MFILQSLVLWNNNELNKPFRSEPADSEAGERLFLCNLQSSSRLPSCGWVCPLVTGVFFSSLHILFPLPGLVIVRLWLLETVDTLTSFVFALPGSYGSRNSFVSSSAPNFGPSPRTSQACGLQNLRRPSTPLFEMPLYLTMLSTLERASVSISLPNQIQPS